MGFAPGRGTDGAARLVADNLAQEFGQGVIVENRAGAGDTIGALSVMRSVPDGQTLFFGAGAEMLINPITR